MPAAESHEPARRILERAVPDADEVTVEASDFPQVVMYACAEMTCPRCGTGVDSDWWGDTVSDRYDDEFRNLIVHMPCCDQNVSLNDLDYHGEGGFARFELSAKNPNVRDIDAELKAALERVLGTPLRQLWLRL